MSTVLAAADVARRRTCFNQRHLQRTCRRSPAKNCSAFLPIIGCIMSDFLTADVVFPHVIAPDTKRPLQAQIRFACEEGYHPSISVRSLVDRSEIDIISLVFGTACSFSSRDHSGFRTLRLDFFPQKDVTHVRPTSILAGHMKLLICFLEREQCELFSRAIKEALLQKAMLKHHYTAELFAPDREQSGTVMYTHTPSCAGAGYL